MADTTENNEIPVIYDKIALKEFLSIITSDRILRVNLYEIELDNDEKIKSSEAIITFNLFGYNALAEKYKDRIIFQIEYADLSNMNIYLYKDVYKNDWWLDGDNVPF